MKVTIEEACKRMNVTPATLRSWIRHKVVPFGIADKKEGATKYSYTIFRKEFEDYVSTHFDSKRMEEVENAC